MVAEKGEMGNRDEEYAALDEEPTRTVPKLGPNGTGWLEQRELRLCV